MDPGFKSPHPDRRKTPDRRKNPDPSGFETLPFLFYLFTIVSGGMEITLDVEKMGQLLNLQPHLVLKDCVKESINRDELHL